MNWKCCYANIKNSQINKDHHFLNLINLENFNSCKDQNPKSNIVTRKDWSNLV